MLDSDLKNVKIAIIGLGNIGLPLALELGKKYQTIGFDIDKQKIFYLNLLPILFMLLSLKNMD